MVWRRKRRCAYKFWCVSRLVAPSVFGLFCDPRDRVSPPASQSYHCVSMMLCKRNITPREEGCTLGYVWFSLLTRPHGLHTNLCYLLDCTHLNTLIPCYLSYKLFPLRTIPFLLWTHRSLKCLQLSSEASRFSWF